MQNALDHRRFLDEGDNTHRLAAAWADQMPFGFEGFGVVTFFKPR
jgi:hypothetical protein